MNKDISELKWTRMGEFKLDDHYSYYCGQESLRRKSSPHSQQKSLKCSTWVQSQKHQNDLCSCQGKPFNITLIQVSAQPLMMKKLQLNEEVFHEDLQEILEPIPKKKVVSLSS